MVHAIVKRGVCNDEFMCDREHWTYDLINPESGYRVGGPLFSLGSAESAERQAREEGAAEVTVIR